MKRHLLFCILLLSFFAQKMQAISHTQTEEESSFNLNELLKDKEQTSIPVKKKSFMESLSKGVQRLFSSTVSQPIRPEDLLKNDFHFPSVLEFYEKQQKDEQTKNTKKISADLEAQSKTEDKRAYLIDLIKGTQFEGDAGHHLIEMIKHSKSDAPLFKGKWANNVVHFLSNPFLVSFLTNVVSISAGYPALGPGLTTLFSITGGGPLRTLHNNTNVPKVFKDLVFSTALIEKAAKIENSINSFPRNLFSTALEAYKTKKNPESFAENAQQIYEVLQKKNEEWKKDFQDILDHLAKEAHGLSLNRAQYLNDPSEQKDKGAHRTILMKIKYEEDQKNQLEKKLNTFLKDIAEAVHNIYTDSQKEKAESNVAKDRYGSSAAVGGIFGNMVGNRYKAYMDSAKATENTDNKTTESDDKKNGATETASKEDGSTKNREGKMPSGEEKTSSNDKGDNAPSPSSLENSKILSQKDLGDGKTETITEKIMPDGSKVTKTLVKGPGGYSSEHTKTTRTIREGDPDFETYRKQASQSESTPTIPENAKIIGQRDLGDGRKETITEQEMKDGSKVTKTFVNGPGYHSERTKTEQTVKKSSCPYAKKS